MLSLKKSRRKKLFTKIQALPNKGGKSKRATCVNGTFHSSLPEKLKLNDLINVTGFLSFECSTLGYKQHDETTIILLPLQRQIMATHSYCKTKSRSEFALYVHRYKKSKSYQKLSCRLAILCYKKKIWTVCSPYLQK